jgi:hypothetical protein
MPCLTHHSHVPAFAQLCREHYSPAAEPRLPRWVRALWAWF